MVNTRSTSLPFKKSSIPVANVSTVPNRSPLRYPGGKTWLVPHIRRWLAKISAPILIEPFAGGGIVSLTAVMEKLVDHAVMIEKARDVAAFWHAALNDGGELIDAILTLEPTREMLKEWELSKPTNEVEHGFRTLVHNRTRRAGILANGAAYMRNGENGRGLLSRWYPDTLANRLASIQQFSSNITFIEGDGMRIWPLLLYGRGSRAAVFLDPPYTMSRKQAGKRLYTDSEIDCGLLFSKLAKSKCHFLLTYEACPEITQLVQLHGFSAVYVEMQNAHNNRRPELVITRERVFD